MEVVDDQIQVRHDVARSIDLPVQLAVLVARGQVDPPVVWGAAVLADHA